MRLIQQLLMSILVLALAALPCHAHGLPHSGDAGFHAHLQNHRVQTSLAVMVHDDDGGLQAAAAEHGKNHSSFHNDFCCCVTCAPSLLLPSGSGLQISRLSRASALPIPRADARRDGALPGAAFRPPIFG